LKLPDPLLVPMATPSTVMVRLARACPSNRSFVPLTSARDTLTAALAAGTSTAVSARTSPRTSKLRTHPALAAKRMIRIGTHERRLGNGP
jgi:hypothetical protein